MEPDSTDLVVWNKEGRPVRVAAGDQDAILALLLRGKLKLDHFLALLDAMEENVTAFGPLLELFRALVGYLPPEEFGRARERLMMLWETSHMVQPPVKKALRIVKKTARQGAKSAVLILAAGLMAVNSPDPDDGPSDAGGASIMLVA